MGGAMSEDEEEESGSERIDGARGVVLDPEKGPTGAFALLCKAASKSLTENMLDLVPCLVENAKQKHLPSLKMLVDLSSKVQMGQEVKPEDVESLAERLLKDLAELDELTVL